ncbi:MAG: AAA family ATPase [Clostridium sp.]|nr:AAA family ATPase [Clostridium sp.]
MRIKTIEIKNFRSYVGPNLFQINSGLTLIIGANGEGKTNLYDAIEWLFENQVRNDNKRVVAKKAIANLIPGNSEEVMVAIDFEHNDSNYRIEKSFSFTKCADDSDIRISPVNFTGYTEEGSTRVQTNGAALLDRCFNASIRHFSLMAGEESLKILNQHQTLQYLIHTFSSVRHSEKYTEFTKYATAYAQRASTNAISKNAKNKRDNDRLTRDIDSLTSQLSQAQRELRLKQEESREYTTQIDAIVNSKEASEEMKALESRLNALTRDRALCQSRIHENYTVALLDDMLVLGGIMPILDEFSAKVAKAERERRKEEHEYSIKLGERKAIKKMKLELENGATPLPVYAPDEKFMREMLNDHICKVCGTPAPEGSAAYNYIQDKLNAYLESLKGEEEPEPCFPFSFIPQLAKRETIINNERDGIAKIYQQILDLLEFNEARKKDLRHIEDNIAKVEEDQRKLQARVPGISKEALLNNFTNLTNWNKYKHECELKIVNLQHTISRLEEQIAQKREDLNKLAENTPAEIYTKIAEAFEAIQKAFQSALVRNKTEFVSELEVVANKYLAKLNVEDFKGTVRIIADVSGALRIQLVDADGSSIDPNKALETTMYMSVLFAVSELTEIKKDDEYPLLFDAPTSSFAVGKEKDFFRIIDNLDKQIIIVTKSFLNEISSNQYVLDEKMINDLDIKGTIYRIEKKRPFDDKDQSTIQTLIQKIR